MESIKTLWRGIITLFHANYEHSGGYERNCWGYPIQLQ